ncbi:hypothetical protein [Flavobacterium sp.]|uniref:hypothetical protein n=1 Tax=Flavobacterium sp. TaxID=239 RepID=UPI0035299DC2
MEPNNIEKNIKNKLEQRTIAPSTAAWDRLDAMLSVDAKPKKKLMVWYYVAASLFVVCGISFWLLNQNSKLETPQNSVVNADESPINETKIIDDLNKDEININETVLPVHTKVVVQNNSKSNQKKPSLNIEDSTNDEVKETLPTTSTEAIATTDKPTTINQYNYISPEKLLATVENKSNSNAKISTPNNNSKSNIKVDAQSLLSSVEKEIDVEYRETTFDKLKRKFAEAREAVANRNYE